MRINYLLILAFDYVLMLVVGAPTREYKELDGHLENTPRERNLEIKFLKSSSAELSDRDRVIFLQWGANIVDQRGFF